MDTLPPSIDEDELTSYFSTELGVEVTETRLLNDKLNVMLAVSTTDDEDAFILRRPNRLRDTSLFGELEGEYELLQRLEETSIPTQSPVHFCDDESVLGEPFFVTTHLEGETIPVGAALPERFQNPTARKRVATGFIDLLAEIHSLDIEPFEGVCERRSPLEQVARATDRLDESARVTDHDLSSLMTIASWLRENAPSESKTTLVHGDFRPSNIVFGSENHPVFAGVIDWETAQLGDPLTELGYFCLYWRDEADPTLPLSELESKYADAGGIQHVRDLDEHGFTPFSLEPGSPTRRELLARYERQTGIEFEHQRFYRAYSAFMLGVVWADLDRHDVQMGSEATRGALIDYMSIVADAIVRGEFRR
ncbi:phosphotransferase [Haloferax sp. MBLA0076]|uniref:Phosphotransferase n=1 Tax=Haloferax litoreum TaxID=2666140 RepID=A0A6A8GGI1_9EURY|nr:MULTISPECIES: phosphotransferase family protein [Haloferax]KAB1192794.1 phosphotransferase family protein [Haloferax sp. CBA1148]MRX21277.1 phosphotransferase [Haloferax litoreum]